MNFFRSFIGTCCGTEVFCKLRDHSWGRTLWHLLILALICSIFIGVGSYYMYKYRWRVAEAGFNGQFGSRVYFAKTGMTPERAPGESRRQEFPYDGLLIYVSKNGAEKDYPLETLVERNFIVLWHPACFALMLRDGEMWSCMRMTPDQQWDDGGSNQWELLTHTQMRARLLKLTELPPSDDWTLPNNYDNGITSRQLFKIIRMGIAGAKAVRCFLGQFVGTLLAAMFFALIVKLFLRSKKLHLSFGTIWKIAVYASFPVMLVTSFFPALQLPGSHMYMNMFIIGWVVYSGCALRRVILSADEEEAAEAKNE